MPTNFVSVLEITAVITTIVQYLSGSIICRSYIKKKSTGDTSGFPFVCGFLSCSLWVHYGFITSERSVILVNMIGTILFLIYILIYYIFTVNKYSYVKQVLIILLLMLALIGYDSFMPTQEQSRKFMGVVCCIITVCFFAAPLSNLVHVIKVKNTDSLPYPLIITSFLVSVQWLIYGIIISDTFLQLPNFMGCLLSLLQMCLFVCYPPKGFSGVGYKLIDQPIVF